MDKNKKIVVTVSGGFDPVHSGHIELFKNAKKLGDELVVIMNNDNWIRAKKRDTFMDEDERKAIVEALKPVDRVVLTDHEENSSDMSINSTLLKIRPDIFANGGDRKIDNIPEVQLCKEINCKMVFNVGGEKSQSSSWLLEKYLDKIKK